MARVEEMSWDRAPRVVEKRNGCFRDQVIRDRGPRARPTVKSGFHSGADALRLPSGVSWATMHATKC
jgi:hypothetical protein